MFASALWLAKQMNLVELVEPAEELFSRKQIELWVVGESRTNWMPRMSAQRDFFNRVPIAAMGGGMAGLPLTPGLHHLSFESVRSQRKASRP